MLGAPERKGKDALLQAAIMLTFLTRISFCRVFLIIFIINSSAHYAFSLLIVGSVTKNTIFFRT